MKIFALRDRLIDYYMTPFAAPEDRQVMAAIATNINSDQGPHNADIKSNPHQFEIWCLAEVKEDGHIEPEKYLVCNCAQLIRRSVREAPLAGAAEATGPANGSAGTPRLMGQGTDAHKPPPADSPYAEGGPPEEVRN